MNRSSMAIFLSLGYLLLEHWPGQARADVRLPAILGSHMVLQQGMPVPLWGWAGPGEAVTVTLGDQSVQATAGEDGRWLVRLAPLKAGGPHALIIRGKNTLTLEDVLVGEVWLASGQSNMEWSVAASDRAKEEIPKADFPRIRLFHVPKVPRDQRAEDVQAEWKVCSPKTVASFSGVAYFFGREIHQAMDVPIGLINSSWGGTRIEPWTPPAGFASVPAFAPYLEKRPDATEAYQRTLDAFFVQIEKKIAEHMPRPAAKEEEADATEEKPAGEEDAGVPAPEDPQAPNARRLQAWLPKARDARQAGKSPPAVEGGWPRGWPAVPADPRNSPGTPMALYNGMVHPLVPFGLRGALWYQGEANCGEGMLYHERMKALIVGWRQVWGQGDFPFYYVQLAPFRYGGHPEALAEIWEAQAATLSVPNTGMAVTTDIGNVGNIHPTNKQEVGRRLSLWALADAYGRKDLVHSGPLYRSMKVEGNRIRIEFDHTGGGLAARDGKPLTHFTVAGGDRQFGPAQAEIENNGVVVWAEAVQQPAAVRFAWRQDADPNLMNREGLPASPFRTDTWERGKAP
ncbi:MAG: sialate O-acetylesterase [Planctomycetes bacterium]|nr:sialate O-acetylesterase [Planctomycetota bacterium]